MRVENGERGQWKKEFFFFNDTATTEIYTLSLHDALPIFRWSRRPRRPVAAGRRGRLVWRRGGDATDEPRWLQPGNCRSEEHTSELQSRPYLVCRLLLEKKKQSFVSSVLYSF